MNYWLSFNPSQHPRFSDSVMKSFLSDGWGGNMATSWSVSGSRWTYFHPIDVSMTLFELNGKSITGLRMSNDESRLPESSSTLQSLLIWVNCVIFSIAVTKRRLIANDLWNKLISRDSTFLLLRRIQRQFQLTDNLTLLSFWVSFSCFFKQDKLKQ